MKINGEIIKIPDPFNTYTGTFYRQDRIPKSIVKILKRLGIEI